MESEARTRYQRIFAIIFVILLFIPYPNNYSSLAHAVEAPSESSGGKWVQVEDSPIAGEGGESVQPKGTRFEGSFDRWTVGETSISFHHRSLDQFGTVDYSDTTFEFTLPAFPDDLNPGDNISLVASGTASGRMTGEAWGAVLEFRSDDVKLLGRRSDGTETPAPWDFGPNVLVGVLPEQGIPTSDSLTVEFSVPEGSANDTINIFAFLWNGIDADVLWVYRYEEAESTEIIDPPSDEDEEDFVLTLVDSLDIYPTMSNSTTFDLDHGSMKLDENISFEIKEKLPYLKVEFDEESLPPSQNGIINNKLTLTFDYTKSSGITLPTIQKITLTAKSVKEGKIVETSKQITLRILPVKWLIMHYVASDTRPSLQENDEININEIITAFGNNISPKVGYMLLLDLENDWDNPPSYKEGAKLDAGTGHLLNLFDGELQLIESKYTDMGSSITLNNFIENSLKIIPAEKKHLIISDHGEGIMGLAKDESPKNSMEISELVQGIGDYHLERARDSHSLEGREGVIRPRWVCGSVRDRHPLGVFLYAHLHQRFNYGYIGHARA